MGNITKPLPVIYSAKRSKISPYEESLYQKLLCEKPLEWAYEEEERIFRTFLTKENNRGKDQYGQDIVLSELPKEAIKEIYLGYFMSEAHKENIQAAISKNGIKCQVFASKICDEEYRIKFELIN